MTIRAAAPAARSSPAAGRPLAPAGAAAAAGLVLGGATSFAQTVLPIGIAPLANSSSGWTLCAVLVVALLRARAALSALLATLCLVCLVVGYQLVSGWRGYPTSEELFLGAALVAGPFVGVATAWLRERGVRAALGAAVLAGIGIGEGAYGLLVVLATTGWVWWTLVAVAGVVLVVVVCVRSLTGAGQRVLCAGLAAALAVAFLAVCSTM